MISSKRKLDAVNKNNDILNSGVDLFVNEPPDEEDVSDQDEDSSSSDDDNVNDDGDSDSSQYSGLEEEVASSSLDDSSDEEEQGSDSDDDDDGKDLMPSDSVDNIAIGTNAKEPAVVDEYEQDSSDEEDIRNTVGNIPMEWYKNYKHIGYDIEGRKLIKPEHGDNLDDFLNKADDPNYWRTVHNRLTGQNIVLSEEDVQLVQNLLGKTHPTQSTEEQYAPWVDWFSSEVMIHPLSNRPEHKRSFIPSKWEKLKVGQMVHALKMGWMKPSKTQEEQEKEEEEQDDKFYMIWNEDEETEISKRYRQHIPAPKTSLPGHAESYNPPPEYLFTKEEEQKWRDQEPEQRRMNFMPQKFSNLRTVPGYSNFIRERFERCLDLYLCPRQRKTRMNVDPEDLIPRLPKPKDLQPFPTTQSLVYLGHTDMVRCISVDPSGQWLVSGSDDCSVRLWEVSTGRCMKTLTVKEKVKGIAWNPNPAVCLVAIVWEKTVVLLNPGVGDKLQLSNTDNMLASQTQAESSADSKVAVSWSVCEGSEHDQGYRLKLTHAHDVSQFTWHSKGDYFATVMPDGQTRSVLIHQLSRRRSQNPFSKSKGSVQCVRFHPLRPFLFVATQRYVRVYNLLKQELSKKLQANCKWVSSMAVHAEGDNVILGSYDSKMSWFDLDLSTKPYQTMKHHKKAIRQVCYHKKYPLFASASDDCSLIVCHGRVYNDMLQNPLIVPVKVLRGHKAEKGVGILDCVFHPSQPWIFSAGADTTIRLYT
ncbi:ribosome biogenesis protein bop1-B-like [Dreissena polymorpha]|uniref:ribosome biogenesis protein bop1-B-like n=1 Tax=Dreissena polymorpha TaxID=45954 RepID=UPI002263B3CE|nr:ribosome biogenesis protein bop1-B-like [Dreissena polymorpha]